MEHLSTWVVLDVQLPGLATTPSVAARFCGSLFPGAPRFQSTNINNSAFEQDKEVAKAHTSQTLVAGITLNTVQGLNYLRSD